MDRRIRKPRATGWSQYADVIFISISISQQENGCASKAQRAIKKRRGCPAIKIDLEKAYDRVEAIRTRSLQGTHVKESLLDLVFTHIAIQEV